MTKNPYLRVFSVNGYFDLATPFFGTEYTLNHLGLDPALRSHLSFGFYRSGHMIYHNDEARRALKADLVRFYREAGALMRALARLALAARSAWATPAAANAQTAPSPARVPSAPERARLRHAPHDRGGRQPHRLHRARRHDPAPGQRQRACGEHVLRRVHGRPRRRAHAPGHVLLERRPRLVDDLAAHGIVRAGPRDVPKNASQPAAAPTLRDNDATLLDTSDLVFVDAVGTGWSTIVARGKTADFYGVDEDAKAFSQFVQRWLTRNGRWQSPKFLFGESYGTTRAANVANLLQNAGVALNGIVLLSAGLDYNFLPIRNGPGEDYAYIGYLPTEAAVAWFHHKAAGNPPDLPRFVAEVRAFAGGPYAQALLRGDTLDARRARRSSRSCTRTPA